MFATIARGDISWDAASALSPRRRLAGLAVAVIGLPLLTVVLSHAREPARVAVGAACSSSCWSVATAATGGPVLAIGTAVVAFLCANYYFTPPLHQFTVEQHENLLALIVFLVVAGVVSAFVDAAARQARDAARARADAETLARLAANVQQDDPLADLVVFVRSSFGLDGASVLARTDGVWHPGGRRRFRAAGDARGRRSDVARSANDVVLALVGGGLTGADRQVLERVRGAAHRRRASGRGSRPRPRRRRS